MPGEDWMYEGRPRKKKDLFSFSANAPYDPGAIAVMTKWKESVGNTAEYSLVRFPQDNTIYCRKGMANDPYQVCQSLSNGTTKTINNNLYYILK